MFDWPGTFGPGVMATADVEMATADVAMATADVVTPEQFKDATQLARIYAQCSVYLQWKRILYGM
jgi:hypothetical protein